LAQGDRLQRNKIHQNFWRRPLGTNLLVMEDNLKYTLTVAEVATHYSLSARTIRNHLNGGTLEGVRLSGSWRCCWHDVWAAEQGPAPRGTRSNLYKTPLNSKKALALNWQVSERTIERWIADGLPTRNVFGSVRIAPADATEWMKQAFNIRKEVNR